MRCNPSVMKAASVITYRNTSCLVLDIILILFCIKSYNKLTAGGGFLHFRLYKSIFCKNIRNVEPLSSSTPWSSPPQNIQLSSHCLHAQNLQGWLSPVPPFLQAPYHTLSTFNYLMQDAGIMPGRHLKGASAFICWDGFSMVEKERGLPEYHEACWCSLQRRTYLCFFLPLCLWLWVSFFLSGYLSSIHSQFFLSFCGGMLAPKRSQATGRVDRSTWGETSTVTSHFATCCSQACTPGTWCTVSSVCVSVTLYKVEPCEKGSIKILQGLRRSI